MRKICFLSSSLKNDLYSNCYKIISDKQNLANQLDEMQQELEIKKANEYFSELLTYKDISNVDVEKASIQNIKVGIDSCDKFIDLLQNISQFTYISDVVVRKITYMKYLNQYYINIIGEVIYDKNNELLNFDVAISYSKKEKNNLENIISNSKTFNNIYSSIKNIDISLSKPNSNYVYSLS